MSRVLVDTILDAGPRQLSATPRDRFDPVVRDLVAQARAEGYDEGLRTGLVRGEAEALEATRLQVDQLSRSLTTAFEEARRCAGVERDAMVAAAAELAIAVAAVVLDREPHDGGTGLLERVRATLEQLEDPAPVVRVSAVDAEVVTVALADLRSVEVETDATLRPGEARIEGGWARADLTQAAAFTAVRRALDVDA
ncbi:MAG: FliH/SctL family protein [Nitriliruptor sp.]|uniref:FliH/SctL family protein n=1 Tax=Nitriliruptor sp. TaxID=2448056 RepID=UPI0034A0A202